MKQKRGDAVGWGTALQSGRSRVRLPMGLVQFVIELFLPAALWPWVRLLNRNEYLGYLLGVNAAGTQG
jgi:hypothetical protein